MTAEGAEDRLYQRAVAAVQAAGEASAPALQKTLGVNYCTVVALTDRMALDRIIAAPNGAGARPLLPRAPEFQPAQNGQPHAATPGSPPALFPDHAAALAKFKIPRAALDAAGVQSVTDTECREALGIHGYGGADLSGILFPYRDPRSGQRIGARVRLDRPLSGGGKYLSEPGCRWLFIPPVDPALLDDAAAPVVFCEAEKSALALAALAERVGRKLLPIATGGCWGWRRTVGKRATADGGTENETGPSPSLDWIAAWKDRTAIIAFDANAASNRSVQAARRRLELELASRGARALIASVPAEPDVNGPDDLIAVSGDAAALAMLDVAARYPSAAHRSVAGPVGVVMADVRAGSVRWLWPGRIPAGKLTVLDGDPGLGKTTLALDVAARVSTGRAMPDGAAGARGGVVIATAEDDLSDTVRPRLDAAGADCSRVLALPLAQFAAVSELDVLRAAIERVGAVLVILDPFVAYLGNAAECDSFRDQDVRRALAPLADLASGSGAAILLIRHLRKSSDSNPLYRGGGSIGIIAAARGGLLAARDPRDPERRVLAVTKSNLAREAPSLSYRMVESSGAAAVEWLGRSDHDAAALLAIPSSAEERGELTEAQEWLRDHLAAGPVSAKDVRRDAFAVGISPRTLDRAKSGLGVQSGKQGFANGWQWALPKDASPPNGANETDLASFGETPLNPGSAAKYANHGDLGVLRGNPAGATVPQSGPAAAPAEPATRPNGHVKVTI
jgi:hypothetical protein